MNAFAHKDDKSKINLGDESDLTGIGDGTAFGAIKEIKSDLTDFSFRVSGGKPQYSIDGGTTWNDLGGGEMPILDYAHPLHEFTSGNTTYTTTQECYLLGEVPNTGYSVSVTIDGKAVAGQGYVGSVPLLKLGIGSVVATTVPSDALKVYKEV